MKKLIILILMLLSTIIFADNYKLKVSPFNDAICILPTNQFVYFIDKNSYLKIYEIKTDHIIKKLKCPFKAIKGKIKILPVENADEKSLSDWLIIQNSEKIYMCNINKMIWKELEE